MFQKVLRYTGRHRKTTYASILVLVAGVAMSVLPYFFLYRLLRPLLTGGSLTLEETLFNAGAMALCMVLYGLLYVEGLALSHRSAYHTLENLRLHLQSKLEKQPLGAIQEKGVGVWKKMFIDDIDSIDIFLKVPLGSYTGDSITPMKVDIFKLSKNLPFPIYSDFEAKDYYNPADRIGSRTYTMTTLNRDSARYYTSNIYNEVTEYYQIIKVPLPKEMGVQLFDLYKTQPETFKDPLSFAKIFPGIYATTTYGDGRVVRVTSTTLNLYFKKRTQIDDKDTIVNRAYAYMGVTPEVVTNNNINYTPSASINERIDKGETLIVAPAGYRAECQLPIKNIIDKYNLMSKEGLTVINTISLSIPAEEIANTKGITPPKYLLLVKESEREDFFKKNKLTDDKTSFWATYDETNKRYVFSGLRSYVKDVIDGNKIDEEGIEKFAIVPIDILFKTVSTNDYSSYYYYYGYTSSSEQEVPDKMTPMVGSPAMVKLKMEDAKITVTYSKKDFNK